MTITGMVIPDSKNAKLMPVARASILVATDSITSMLMLVRSPQL